MELRGSVGLPLLSFSYVVLRLGTAHDSALGRRQFVCLHKNLKNSGENIFSDHEA